MKLLHICPFLGEQLGGSERYVKYISEEQARYTNVSVYTTTKYRSCSGVTKSKGVYYNRFYSPIIIWNINPLAIVLRSMLNSKADIFHVHSHLYLLSNQAMMAKVLKQKHALLHIHGGVGPPPYKTSMTRTVAKRFYDRTLGKFTVKNSNMIASVSQRDLKFLSETYSIPLDRMRYIPNAIDTIMFSPADSVVGESEHEFLYVGDLELWKGVGLLMKWMSLFNKEPDSPRIKMRFIGQGSLSDKLMDLARKLPSQGNRVQIDVMGPRRHSEVAEVMRKSRALILPSYWEGMPTVLLEAMASGIPTISTPVGEIPEVIDHMKTGLLINESYKSFLDAITTVVEDEKGVHTITKNARNLIVNNFSINQVARILLDTYAELLSS